MRETHEKELGAIGVGLVRLQRVWNARREVPEIACALRGAPCGSDYARNFDWGERHGKWTHSGSDVVLPVAVYSRHLNRALCSTVSTHVTLPAADTDCQPW